MHWVFAVSLIPVKQFLNYRKRWVEHESTGTVNFSRADLTAEHLLKHLPYARSCFSDKKFKLVLAEALQSARDAGFAGTAHADTKALVLELKAQFLAKWREVPFKRRNIARHLPFTDFNVFLVVPPSSQAVKVASLNVFAENLGYFEVPVDSSRLLTKRDLIHEMLTSSTELLENLVSDESDFGDETRTRRLGWFQGVSTINLVQNRLGEASTLAQEVDLGAGLEMTAQDVRDHFSRFGLETVFEVHRLDLFQGSLHDFSFYPLDEA